MKVRKPWYFSTLKLHLHSYYLGRPSRFICRALASNKKTQGNHGMFKTPLDFLTKFQVSLLFDRLRWLSLPGFGGDNGFRCDGRFRWTLVSHVRYYLLSYSVVSGDVR